MKNSLLLALTGALSGALAGADVKAETLEFVAQLAPGGALNYD